MRKALLLPLAGLGFLMAGLSAQAIPQGPTTINSDQAGVRFGSPEALRAALDAALAAGVTPIGAVTTRGGDNVAQYVTDYLNAHELAHPEIVGVVREINIEAVLAQQPDLILAAAQLPEEQYQLLSQIAPTTASKSKRFCSCPN